MGEREIQAELKQLGIPPKSVVKTVTLGGEDLDKRWKGYSAILAGVLIDVTDDKDTYPFPFYRIQDSKEAKGGILQLWLQKVAHTASPVYGEIRWHPKHEYTIAIRGLEKGAEEHDILRALKGLRLLSKAMWQSADILPKEKRKKGRPKDSEILGKLTPRRFKSEYTELKGEYRKYKSLPTQADMAESLNVSRTTLYRFLKYHGLKWPPI
jgi:hypothetical protein